MWDKYLWSNGLGITALGKKNSTSNKLSVEQEQRWGKYRNDTYPEYGIF